MTKQEVIDSIAAIPTVKGETGYSRITEAQAVEIAALLNGDSGLFLDLDNHPPQSTSGEEWHWKLRQARNNHPAFWERLKADEEKS